MTLRGVYEGLLIELNKVQAPSILVEDFNYFVNKSVNQYVNKKYTSYDMNQQSGDDLRVLKATTTIDMTLKEDSPIHDGLYEGYLPDDYLHLLNCVCVYKVEGDNFKCYKKNDTFQQVATRLTADIWGQVINNAYMKPSYKRPYYYLNYINNATAVPTNKWDQQTNPSGTDMNENGYNSTTNPNLPRTYSLAGSVPVNLTNVPTAQRLPNTSKVRIEIRTGNNQKLNLISINVDYLKAPQHLRLTQQQIDLVEDTSQIMEFPDYVCQEIINELTHLVMENSSDPRLQTHLPITMSIANPAQASASQ